MAQTSNLKRWSVSQCLKDTAYLLFGWPLLLGAFIGVTLLLGVGLPLTPFGVGIPIAMAALGLAHGVARYEARMQATLLNRPVSHRDSLSEESDRSRIWNVIRQPERVGELALSLVGWLPATVIGSLTLAWWVSALAFVGLPIWSRFADGHYSGLASLLHIPGNGIVRPSVDLTFGLILLALTPWVMRGFAAVQSSICRYLLEAPVRPVQAAMREREHRSRLNATRDAEAQVLRRVERDLHDGPQQRLVRLQMDVARAERVADDPQRAREILGGVREQAQAALEEVRSTSRGIAPQVLTQYGFAQACEEIAGRCPIRMKIDMDLPRLQPATETALYYLVSEAVTNSMKHSGATVIQVTGHVAGDYAVVTITDNGCGGATMDGTGLLGLRQRLAAVDGALTVNSPHGGPTTVEGRALCES